jgi:lipoyl synthase
MFDRRLFDNRLPVNPETSDEEGAVQLGHFPSWLHRKLPQGNNLFKTNRVLKKNQLNTVCEEAKCPNRFECFSKKTATFLVLGKECTRNCGFCSIDFSKQPQSPESDEPERVAEAVKELGLKHVVITMVARDDLADGGAHHLSLIIRAVRKVNPSVTVEVLTSDFSENLEAIDLVLSETPEIFNHNIETVRSLTPRVRHRATYERTLSILSHVKAKKRGTFIKSGIMVGLGEREEEVKETIQDLYRAGCEIITIGQYLQPTRHKLRVKTFVTPEQFKLYETFGLELGVKYMYSGPFVRSSYNAELISQALNVGS